MAKPDGVLIVPIGEELQFLAPLPVQRLWGVGPKTLAKLERIGVRTIGDVRALPEGTLESTLGTAHGRHLAELARNLDPRPIERSRDAKSVGNEETFAHDIRTPAGAERELLALADRVAGRLRARRRDRPGGDREGAVRRLHHDHPLAHADRPTDLAAVIGATARG